jgi:acyl transferase domain-containing protein
VSRVVGDLAGECDLALVGGITMRMTQAAGYLAEESGLLSRMTIAPSNQDAGNKSNLKT